MTTTIEPLAATHTRERMIDPDAEVRDTTATDTGM